MKERIKKLVTKAVLEKLLVEDRMYFSACPFGTVCHGYMSKISLHIVSKNKLLLPERAASPAEIDYILNFDDVFFKFLLLVKVKNQIRLPIDFKTW